MPTPDCGAYARLEGGFHGDLKREPRIHQRELARRRQLTETIPGLEVQAYFIDFEGVWER